MAALSRLRKGYGRGRERIERTRSTRRASPGGTRGATGTAGGLLRPGRLCLAGRMGRTSFLRALAPPPRGCRDGNGPDPREGRVQRRPLVWAPLPSCAAGSVGPSERRSSRRATRTSYKSSQIAPTTKSSCLDGTPPRSSSPASAGRCGITAASRGVWALPRCSGGRGAERLSRAPNWPPGGDPVRSSSGGSSYPWRAMCGIRGVSTSEPQAPRPAVSVAVMNELLAHRGPDGEGIWIHPRRARRVRAPPADDHRPRDGRPADGRSRRQLDLVQRRDLQLSGAAPRARRGPLRERTATPR